MAIIFGWGLATSRIIRPKFSGGGKELRKYTGDYFGNNIGSNFVVEKGILAGVRGNGKYFR